YGMARELDRRRRPEDVGSRRHPNPECGSMAISERRGHCRTRRHGTTNYPSAASARRTARVTGAVALAAVAVACTPAMPRPDATADHLPATPPARSAHYDLLLRNGRIIDGTGNPWYVGDIAVSGDEIVRIAPRINAEATRVIDVAGQVIAPGFID